ncbi:hypothetical protein DSO57_1015977 [Entomophthora muscae]|uniref:Uncharacterized protein n=1 Tax=Entomophthora muscae TaxID=34485 RepID=A0ACC2U314_9FUNG|nr:hypothetical protein DSO57_1015977 [Entomophthora muscae]
MSLPRRLLFVGLGNHGFPGTRHNVGMMALDALAKDWNFHWESCGSCLGFVAQGIVEVKLPRIKKKKPPVDPEATHSPVVVEPPPPTAATYEITLMKPKQFMNVNGKSIAATAKVKKFNPEDVIIFHDDLERELGVLSWKVKGSANGHNGVVSAIGALRTNVSRSHHLLNSCQQEFLRMRIGINRPTSKNPAAVASYVLAQFAKAEQLLLHETLYTSLPAKVKEKLVALAAKGKLP